MAISAGTISKDRVSRQDGMKQIFPSLLSVIDATITFKQGDMLFLDTTAHLVKKVTGTGDAATFVGIAPVAVTLGSLVGPYSGLASSANQAPQDAGGPIYGGSGAMILKTADAFNPGDKVYLADATNTQTVSSTDPGDHNYVGIYVGPAIASAAAGQEGQIKIIARYPTVLA